MHLTRSTYNFSKIDLLPHPTNMLLWVFYKNHHHALHVDVIINLYSMLWWFIQGISPNPRCLSMKTLAINRKYNKGYPIPPGGGGWYNVKIHKYHDIAHFLKWCECVEAGICHKWSLIIFTQYEMLFKIICSYQGRFGIWMYQSWWYQICFLFWSNSWFKLIQNSMFSELNENRCRI